MQTPITLLPPMNVLVPVTPGSEGGWGGLTLTGVHGAPCLVEWSADGLEWQTVSSWPHTLDLGWLRLTATADPEDATLATVLAVLALAADGGAGAGEDSASEPQPLVSGAGVPLDLAEGGFRRFELDLSGGPARLTVTTTGGLGNLRFYLYDQPFDPNTYAVAQGSGSGTEYTLSLTPQARTYYLEVDALEAVSGATLTATWEAAGP